MEMKELKERQSWSLERKIDHAMATVEQFYSRLEGKVYLSFSGGRDSTVLLWLIRKEFPDIMAVFCNTGNEYPDIVYFVREMQRSDPNIEIIRPELTPKEVVERFGFPLISKSTSAMIGKARRNPDGKVMQNYIRSKDSLFSVARKWEFLLDAEYDVSEKCCYYLKKKPFRKYHSRTGLYPISGEMASESMSRTVKYLQAGGCNQFGNTVISKPLSIWTERDIDECIGRYGIKVAGIYGKGADRTGCMFCGYGCQFRNDTRLRLVYDLYPKWYEKFMGYTNHGIPYRKALRDVLSVNGLDLPDESEDLFGKIREK